VVTEGVQRALPGAKVNPQQIKLSEAAADQDDTPAAASEPAKPPAPAPAK
jgi:hypothetical protein